MYSFLINNNLLRKTIWIQGKRSVNHVLVSTTEFIKSQLEHGNYVNSKYSGGGGGISSSTKQGRNR